MDNSDTQNISTNAGKTALTWTWEANIALASGLTVGVLIGWMLRGNKNTIGMVKPFKTVWAVSKSLVTHGKVPQTKLALVVRSDLLMTRGKIAAQCGHAAVGAMQNFTIGQQNLLDLWLNTGQTKVVLKIAGEDELLGIATKAREVGVDSFLVRDAGRTEVASGTATVVAVGPAELSKVNQITGSLSLL